MVMKLKIKTSPDLSATSEVHQQALQDGDEHFRRWQRNVVDKYKDKSEEDIRINLKETAFPFAILCENFINDFNIATTFRNANAFNCSKIFYIGNKKLDRRGMTGIHNYSDITWLPTIEDLLSLQKNYTFVGADNIPGSVPLSTYRWPTNPLIVFGSEEVGLTPHMQSLCKYLVFIEQFGSVRSLNVATASGIFMNDFVSKYRGNNVLKV
jgi:tRNA G18 (ribose-2'-O)-methylase SpoU